ncbi:MAG TPA: glutamyl-tRNA reductase [Acidimicrobiales bacterium]|nr:glutamyl-tRNA reductase [Acidimicrobiales bacterium]
MSVVVVGLEHRLAPLDVLGRVSVAEADLPKALGELRDRVNLQESVLLSTCLRTEVYSVVDRFHDAVSEVQDLLARRAGSSVAELEPYLRVRFDDEVPGHLFAVASGLESAVLGESEVLGQVRRAWEQAHHERVSGPVLAGLFRHAVRTGKRVRAETGIARGTTSFAHAAVEHAERARRGGLSGASVVVLGAGAMGAGMVGALLGRPEGERPAEVVVVNRTLSRAEVLASQSPPGVAVRAVAFRKLPDVAGRADVVLVALGAGHTLGAAELGRGGAGGGRPTVVVDVGMPPSVDPSVRGLPGVTLLDMADLRGSVVDALEGRRAELERARSIVGEEVERYRAAARSRGAAPVVAALRNRLEALRMAELDRHRSRLGAPDGPQWAAVDSVTRAVLAKLVHEPTVLLKDTAGTPRGERLVEALRALFDL